MAVNYIQSVTKLGQIQTAVGLVEDSPWNVQIGRVFPFMGIDGYALAYASQPQIAMEYNFGTDDPAEAINDTSALIATHIDSPSNAADYSRTFKLGELATRYQIPYSQKDRYTYPNDLNAVERLYAERRIFYRYFGHLGQTGGVASDGDFLGLAGICDGTRKIAPAGATLALRHVDEAYYMVTDGPGRPNAIMSHSRALRTVLKLCYDSQISWPMDMVEVELDDPQHGRIKAKLPAWRGTPWFTNDCLQVTGAGPYESPIFMMLLGDSETPGGGRGVTGIIPRDRVGNMFIHREVSAATQYVDPTTYPATPAINVDCTFPVGLACGSRGALSMIHTFNLVANGA